MIIMSVNSKIAPLYPKIASMRQLKANIGVKFGTNRDISKTTRIVKKQPVIKLERIIHLVLKNTICIHFKP